MDSVTDSKKYKDIPPEVSERLRKLARRRQYPDIDWGDHKFPEVVGRMIALGIRRQYRDREIELDCESDHPAHVIGFKVVDGENDGVKGVFWHVETDIINKKHEHKFFVPQHMPTK